MSHRSATSSASHYVFQLTADLPGKGLWLALSALWASIPQMYLYAVGWLVLDLMTGLWKMRVSPVSLNQSGKGQDGILKITIYLAMLTLAEYAAHTWSAYADAVRTMPVLGEYLAPILLLVTKGLPFVASFLITHTETTSCLENLQAIAQYKGKRVPALDILLTILRVRHDQIIQALTGGTGPLQHQPQPKGGDDDQRIEP